MQKDFKIGLFIGVLIAIATLIWLCTLPKLSTIARAMQSSSTKNVSTDAPLQISQAVAQSPAPTPQVIDIESPAPAMNNEQSTITNNQSPRFHLVLKGDSLSKIAEKYYGSPRSWQKIVSANHDILPDPNHLKPGIKLIIP
jgi:nucleoid-associated protein YgaU